MDNFESNPFYKEAPKPQKNRGIINLITFLAVIAIISLVSWFTILGQNLVDGPSMRANFYTGDFLLINRFPALFGQAGSRSLGIDYERGDIIVLHKPGFPEFVKRVIALEGESIAISRGRIFINGQVMVEDYLAEQLYTNGGSFIQEDADPIVVPPGYLIAIGDNRPESDDSRFEEIGFIKREWIKGKVFFRLMPMTIFQRGTYKFVDPNTYDFSVADPEFRYPTTRTGQCYNLSQCF